MRTLGLAALFLGASAAAAQTIDEFPIPTDASSPQTITAGPDGNLWFTEQAADKIARMTTSGIVTEFPIAVSISGSLFGITAGPDGSLWFPDLYSKKVGKIATDGTVTEYPVTLPHPFSSGGITPGPDGALWFTANSGFFNPRGIGRVDTSGNAVVHDVWSSQCCFYPDDGPYGIATGSDGNLWFTVGRAVGRIGTDGFASPMAAPAGFAGGAIAAGADGNLWFTDSNANGIGRVTTAGAIVTFPIPTAGAAPQGIAAGSDGNVWFTETSGNAIARITPFGEIHEFPIATKDAGPAGIASGPDGALWFAESAANQIGRISTGAGAPPGVLSIVPTSGPAGGAQVTLKGSGFVAGAAVHIGDVAAAGVTVVDSETITATTPSLPAGGVFDVVVTNPDAASGTLPEGWFADFVDVPPAYPYHAAIETIVRAHITAGCGAGLYCPAGLVDRSSMAKFLLRGAHGRYYLPPYASGAGYYIYSDVSSTNPLYRWIYELAAEAITTGCGGTLYCPDAAVNRASMSVFLLRGKNGPSFAPPAATGSVFGDVQATTYLARWIEALAAAGITQGCGGGNFCPDQPVTRGEMAKFLKKTFLP